MAEGRSPRLGLRARAATLGGMIAVVVLGGTVVLGASVLRRALVDQLDRELAARAEDTVGRMEEDDTSLDAELVPLPFGGDSTFAAVWDVSGVITRNDDVADETLARFEELAVGVATVSVPEATDIAGAGRLRVAVDVLDGGSLDFGDGADSSFDGEGTVFVAVGAPLQPIDELIASIRRWGLAAAAALSVGVAVLAWWLTGRALRPVDAMRAEAERIRVADPSRRIPVGRADELGRLALTLNEMLDRISATQAAHRRFVADASHELRNPVAAVQANLETALRTPERDDWPELASTALADVSRLRRLADDLLLLAQHDDGGMAASRTDLVDVDDVALAAAGPLRIGTPVEVQVNAGSGAVVRGDADRLVQAVVNLVANAVRHARSVVVVTVVDDGLDVRVVVDDDGPGVPIDSRASVFERFARLDDARARDRGGAGLGLPIVDAIARAHGGTVSVTDAPQGGARLTITLPSAPVSPAGSAQ